MTYSDTVGLISGALQFAVAYYALRVSRRFGLARVGWYFFGAFSLFALVHVLVSVHPFGLHLIVDAMANFLYEVVAVLLLACIAHTEVLLRKDQQKKEAELRLKLERESRAEPEEPELAKANRELLESVAQLQAELVQQKEAYEQAEKAHQEQLANLSRSEEALRDVTVQLRTEVDQQKQLQEQLENTYQQQVSALRQSEGEWRETAARLQAEAASQNVNSPGALSAEPPQSSATSVEAGPESLATHTGLRPDRPARSRRSRSHSLKQSPTRLTRRSGDGVGRSLAKRRAAR